MASPTPPDVFEQVLEAIGLSIAVVEGAGESTPRLVWCNGLFASEATRQGTDAASLADAVVAGTATGSRRKLSRIDESGPQRWLLILEGARHRPPTRDTLTSTLSRSALDDTLGQWFQRRGDQPFVVAFIDLVGFKDVNDRLGHVAGDTCLAEVGRRLHRAIRSGDVVGRYGGDEFLLLLRGSTGIEATKSIRERVLAELEAPFEASGARLRLSASIGFAGSGAADDPVGLVAAADAAMYADKRQFAGEKRAAWLSDVADRALLG